MIEQTVKEWQLSPTTTDNRLARPWVEGSKGYHVIDFTEYEKLKTLLTKIEEHLMDWQNRPSLTKDPVTKRDIRKALSIDPEIMPWSEK